MGVDIHTKIVPFDNRDKDIELYLFDTAGHPLYQQIVQEIVNNNSVDNSQYKGANYLLFVYDCTNKGSVDFLQGAYEKIKKANGGKDVPGYPLNM